MSTEEDIAKGIALIGPLVEVGKSIYDAIDAASRGDLEAAKAAHENAMAANARAVLELAKLELPG